MCINQAIELLLVWFEDHDSFRMNKDFMSLDWALLDDEKSNKEEKEGCVKIALRKLEEENLAVGTLVENGSEEVWVLMNSQQTSPRQIHLSPKTCENISLTVNSFLPMMDIGNNQKSDPKNIGEADVIILLSVIKTFANRLDELEKAVDTKKKKK